MNIHILWNECVDKTTDISSCIELYTKRIIKEKNEEFDKILDELRSNNPYPNDIFTGKTEEGKIGQFGRIVYNNALEDIKQKIRESEE